MKIAYGSDFHNEFYYKEHYGRQWPLEQGPKFEELDSDVDVIVLAGDIWNIRYAPAYCSAVYDVTKKPVIFVPGNHEYYHLDRSKWQHEYPLED